MFSEYRKPAVSQHLRKLKEAGIITERKVGTWKHYRLVEDQTPLMKGILEQIQPLNGVTVAQIVAM